MQDSHAAVSLSYPYCRLQYKLAKAMINTSRCDSLVVNKSQNGTLATDSHPTALHSDILPVDLHQNRDPVLAIRQSRHGRSTRSNKSQQRSKLYRLGRPQTTTSPSHHRHSHHVLPPLLYVPPSNPVSSLCTCPSFPGRYRD